MAKYPGQCPANYDMDIYTGCPSGCLYCVEAASHKSPGTPADTALNLIHRMADENTGQHPVYLSPKTEAYQPMEQEAGITRQVLAHLAAAGKPFFVITKEPLVWRDREFFTGRENAFIAVSMNTLDDALAARLEPGAAAPSARRDLVTQLCTSGNVRVVVKIDPVISGISDGARLETLLAWLETVRPFAVTAETLRMNLTMFQRISEGLGQNEAETLASHYPGLTEDIVHPAAEYRLSLFRGIARRLAAQGIRSAFCRASLPESITEYDCRGGFGP